MNDGTGARRCAHLLGGVVELIPEDAHALRDLAHRGLLVALADEELVCGLPLIVGEDEVGRHLLRTPHGARAFIS